jgi:hypothetical protein
MAHQELIIAWREYPIDPAITLLPIPSEVNLFSPDIDLNPSYKPKKIQKTPLIISKIATKGRS